MLTPGGLRRVTLAPPPLRRLDSRSGTTGFLDRARFLHGARCVYPEPLEAPRRGAFEAIVSVSLR